MNRRILAMFLDQETQYRNEQKRNEHLLNQVHPTLFASNSDSLDSSSRSILNRLNENSTKKIDLEKSADYQPDKSVEYKLSEH